MRSYQHSFLQTKSNIMSSLKFLNIELALGLVGFRMIGNYHKIRSITLSSRVSVIFWMDRMEYRSDDELHRFQHLAIIKQNENLVIGSVAYILNNLIERVCIKSI